MSGMSTGHQHNSGRYEIRVQGRIKSWCAAWFDGMTLTPDSDGTTTIHGPVVDQAALHGLLRKLRDVGLPPCRSRSCRRSRRHQPLPLPRRGDEGDGDCPGSG